MLDHDEGPPSVSSLSRSGWRLVVVCWAAIAILTILLPGLLMIWPISAFAWAIVLIGVLRDYRALLRRREPLGSSGLRHLAVWLVLVGFGAILGTVSACIRSMGFLSKTGVLRYEYSLSRVIAPAAFTVIVIVVVHALRSLSLRRTLLVIVTTLFAWPFLVGIRVLHLPWLDIDQQFVLLAPWATYAYAGSLAVVSGSSLALAITSYRLAALPAREQPPRAVLL